MTDTQDLQHAFIKKAISWVLADRTCDDRMATVDRIKREVDAHLSGGQPASERDRELLEQLEREEIAFKLACQRESSCNEELRAAARVLVEALEKGEALELPPALHVLSEGRALCSFSLETPSRWPIGHQWTSLAELREGVTKIEDLSCVKCSGCARIFFATEALKEKP